MNQTTKIAQELHVCSLYYRIKTWKWSRTFDFLQKWFLFTVLKYFSWPYLNICAVSAKVFLFCFVCILVDHIYIFMQFLSRFSCFVLSVLSMFHATGSLFSIDSLLLCSDSVCVTLLSIPCRPVIFLIFVWKLLQYFKFVVLNFYYNMGTGTCTYTVYGLSKFCFLPKC